jgi:ferrous iron transport protein B
MELPFYHAPHFKGILIQAWHRTAAFIRQAGGMILIFAIGIFLLSWHPSGDIQNSILGHIGVFLDPIGKLFGADWRMMVALITSFVVKENTIATLGILTHVTSEPDTMSAVRAILTPQAAVAFMVIQMLFVPCVSTLVTFKREAGSWRWPVIGMTLQGVVSLVCGILLYQIVK